jgi:hypothetical protein
VISGKAFSAAQGPVAARAALKHIVMAEYMQRVNSYALQLYDKLFPNEEIAILRVSGGVATNLFPKAAMGSSEYITFVPSRDINGRYDNLLTFSPMGTDRYRQSIEWLQYAEAGIISLNFIRENTQGIDPQAMEAEVAREFMEKAERAVRAGEMQMESQMQMQAAMAPQMAPPGQAPGAQAASAPAAPGPEMTAASGSPPPPLPQEAPGGRGRVTLREATQVFKSVRNLRNEVYLGGAIAVTGSTTGPIEVYVADPQDKGTLINGTPYGKQGKLLFHPFPLPTDERVVNVTPTDVQVPEEVAVGQTA